VDIPIGVRDWKEGKARVRTVQDYPNVRSWIQEAHKRILHRMGLAILCSNMSMVKAGLR
jgi:hypothetical protein